VDQAAGISTARGNVGRVYGSARVEEALSAEGLAPDFTYSRPHADTELMFLHRSLPNTEIYFLTNRQAREEKLDVSFRITGKAPEVWHAETGQTQPLSYRIENGRTTVPLNLRPYDALFVVFQKVASADSHTELQESLRPLAVIDGSWNVAFQPNRGAPPAVTLPQLQSWNINSDPGVKYFSGTATYTKAIDAPNAWFKRGQRLMLDLGDVREIASVSLNGKSLGVLWNPPFRVDVTDVLRRGKNTLEVKVTDLWVNRVIGDKQPGVVQYSVAPDSNYLPTAPLIASGLLGPVSLLRATPDKDK
jgi:hypothetical protein